MDIQLFEETKVEEKKVSFEQETKVEAKNESVEEGIVEEGAEVFELNKKKLTVFKHLLRQAEQWMKQEKVRVKGLKREHREDKAIWKPRKQAYEEILKKVEAELMKPE